MGVSASPSAPASGGASPGSSGGGAALPSRAVSAPGAEVPDGSGSAAGAPFGAGSSTLPEDGLRPGSDPGGAAAGPGVGDSGSGNGGYFMHRPRGSRADSRGPCSGGSAAAPAPGRPRQCRPAPPAARSG